MIRSEGYLQSREDFENVPVTTGGVTVLLNEVARVIRGPTLRRGIAELDGEGEVVGGLNVLRSGQTGLARLDAVPAKLPQLQGRLPAGVQGAPGDARPRVTLAT